MSETVSMADFQAFELLDTGERSPISVELSNIKSVLNVENVLLLVRLDLRRLFIWKGPKSPVRKRFISSREGAKIQEEMAKFGMHLKIISVDAGEEPAEFLQSFNVESMVISEADKMEDLRYTRNEERRKAEEGKPGAVIADPSTFKPKTLGELKGQSTAAESQTTMMPSTATMAAAEPMSVRAAAPIQTASRLGGAEEKAILDKILKGEVPAGYKRLNIIIGTSLYGPQKVVKKVFGKEVESEDWGRISELPAGKVDISGGLLHAYMANNMVEGIEVLQADGEAPVAAPKPPATAEAPKKKRELPPIPKGE
jgi:hypothetical protein